MDRRPRYYAIKITVLAVLLAGGWAAFVALGDSWYQLLVAVYLAARVRPDRLPRPRGRAPADLPLPPGQQRWSAWCTATC